MSPLYSLFFCVNRVPYISKTLLLFYIIHANFLSDFLRLFVQFSLVRYESNGKTIGGPYELFLIFLVSNIHES